MAIKYLTSIDLCTNEIQNVSMQNLGEAPALPKTGRIYYDTTLKVVRYFNGTDWVNATQDTNTDTTYALSGKDHTITLTGSDSTTSSYTIPDNNTTYTITANADTRKITLTPSTGTPTVIELGAAAWKSVDDTIDTSTTAPRTGLTTSGAVFNYVSNQLTNYYKKTETYSQSEINNMIGAIHSFEIKIVASLPTTGDTNTIYFIPKSPTQTNNVYEEWLYVNSKWEKIGDTAIDLSEYVNSITVTGTGNAVTSITKSGNALTITKGATFLTAHPAISMDTNTTSTQTATFGGNFTVIDSVTKDSNGHVTKVNTKTVTLPSNPVASNTAKSYTGTNPALTASGGVCTWTITHNLNNADIIVQIKEVSSGSHVMADIKDVTVNTCSIMFTSSNIAAGVYKVKIIG